MIDSELLKILCCPETHQPLAYAGQTVLEQLNRDIAAGRLKNRGGKPVTEKVDAGLATADGRIIYPVRNNIPILLVDEGISLTVEKTA